MQTLYQAVWQDRYIYLRYQPALPVEIDQVVQPYGLVAKAGVWYLVCAANERLLVLPASSLREARLMEQTFTHPPGFDLAAFWAEWCAEEQRRRSLFRAQVRLPRTMINWLPVFFGENIQDRVAAAQPDLRGYIILELAFESFEAARARLLSLGSAIEVLEPLALRKSLADYARQILTLYEG
ncbi:MAG: WYL domain-containing protein [Bellilinea sp.]